MRDGESLSHWNFGGYNGKDRVLNYRMIIV